MVFGLTYISQQSCAVKIFRRQIVTRKRKKQIPLKYSRKQYQKVQFSQTNNYLAFSFYDGKNYLNLPFWKLSWNNKILKIIWEKNSHHCPQHKCTGPHGQGPRCRWCGCVGRPAWRSETEIYFNVELVVVCNWPFMSLIILRQSFPD